MFKISFTRWISIALAAAFMSACSGGVNSQSPIPVAPEAISSPIPDASPNVSTMDVVSHSTTNWDFTGTLVSQLAGNEWQVQGGTGLGYVHVYTTSSTIYGTGVLPFAAGEPVEITGTASTTTSTPTAITATRINKLIRVTPLAAAAFDDSVGVVASINNQGTGYDSGWATYSPLLIKSGIKHIRDGFCSHGTYNSWCTGTWASRMKQLASAGIHSNIVWDPRNCWSSADGSGCQNNTTPTNVYASTFGIASEVESYEGPNECDISNLCAGMSTRYPASYKPYYSYPCSSFGTCMSTDIHDLATMRSSSVKVYGPAMGHYGSTPGYSCCGIQSAYMDAGSIHDYPGNNYPENNVVPPWTSAAAKLSGSARVVATETGYNTDPTFANQGVSRLAQERYIPRLLLTHLQRGVMRTYLFELFDEQGSGSGFQFGLLTQSYTPKPIWKRLTQQLMPYFADSGTSPRTPLTYGLTGDTTGTLHQLLFQRSDGNYILVPWLATQLWNWSTHTDMSPAKETLKLTLPSSVTSVTVTQFGDNGATSVITLSRINGTFAVPVSSLIEAVKFHT